MYHNDNDPQFTTNIWSPQQGAKGRINSILSNPSRCTDGETTILCKGRRPQAVYIGERGRKYVYLSCKSLGKSTKGYEYVAIKEARKYYSDQQRSSRGGGSEISKYEQLKFSKIEKSQKKNKFEYKYSLVNAGTELLKQMGTFKENNTFVMKSGSRLYHASSVQNTVAPKSANNAEFKWPLKTNTNFAITRETSAKCLYFWHLVAMEEQTDEVKNNPDKPYGFILEVVLTDDIVFNVVQQAPTATELQNMVTQGNANRLGFYLVRGSGGYGHEYFYGMPELIISDTADIAKLKLEKIHVVNFEANETLDEIVEYEKIGQYLKNIEELETYRGKLEPAEFIELKETSFEKPNIAKIKDLNDDAIQVFYIQMKAELFMKKLDFDKFIVREIASLFPISKDKLVDWVENK
jgi:hypothetical protein